jgi:hypothetical protein
LPLPSVGSALLCLTGDEEVSSAQGDLDRDVADLDAVDRPFVHIAKIVHDLGGCTSSRRWWNAHRLNGARRQFASVT